MKLKTESFAEKLVSACFSLLMGAIALYVAVRLVEAIWLSIVVILGTALLLVAAVRFVRGRSDGW